MAALIFFKAAVSYRRVDEAAVQRFFCWRSHNVISSVEKLRFVELIATASCL